MDTSTQGAPGDKFSRPRTTSGVAHRRAYSRAIAWLAARPIRRIYASPLKRAIQTAEIAGARIGLGFTVAEELREIDCGALEGRSDPEAWEAFGQIIYRWVDGDLDDGFESGETGRHAVDRLGRLLNSLPNPDGDTLLVGHGGIFAIGLMHLCFDLKPASRSDLHLPNTGIVLVERTPDGFSCVKWGLSEHLDQPSVVDVPAGVPDDR